MTAVMPHVSVMPREVLELATETLVSINPEGLPRLALDGTAGQGGHSFLILDNTPDFVTLFSVDRDFQAVQETSRRLIGFSDRLSVFHCGYDEARRILSSFGRDGFDFILLDLGQSSTQYGLGRGFSFSADPGEPLDLRFDTRDDMTATDVIIDMPVNVLADRFRELAQVPMAGRLARILKEEAGKNRLGTVGEFVAVCHSVYGPRIRKMASPTLPMQALRIMVNRELQRLSTFFDILPELLAENGRLVTCAFHSGEDRICKTRMRELALTDAFSLPFRKVMKPSDEECRNNPRARSTRLRALDRRCR